MTTLDDGLAITLDTAVWEQDKFGGYDLQGLPEGVSARLCILSAGISAESDLYWSASLRCYDRQVEVICGSAGYAGCTKPSDAQHKALSEVKFLMIEAAVKAAHKEENDV